MTRNPIRRVVVYSQPVAIGFAVALGKAHPDVGLLSVLHGSTNPLQATTKGYGVAGKDFHVGIFDLDGPLKLVEKFLIVFLIRFEPFILQRRNYVVGHQCLPSVINGHDPVQVLGAEGLGPSIQ